MFLAIVSLFHTIHTTIQYKHFLHSTNMATSNEQQYDEQVRVLQERFPEEPNEKLVRLLRRFHGDVDQVCLKLLNL